MAPLDISVTVQTAPDILGIFLNATAVLVAALIGLGGLLLVNKYERKQKRQDRSDLAFEHLMSVIGSRAQELHAWLNSPATQGFDKNGIVVYEQRDQNKTTGGPLDVELQTAADVTAAASTQVDRPVAIAVADVLYHFKRALTSWQVRNLGEVVGNIRKWRSGELSERDFIVWTEELKKKIEAGEEHRARPGPDHVNSQRV